VCGWTGRNVALTLGLMQVARAAFAFSLAVVAPLGAQAPVYDGTTLACGRFRESVRGTLQGNLGGGDRSERVGRDGVLEIRAASAGGLVVLESWYDSLSVFREGPEGRYEPDAGGMIGGRYRGRIESDGRYQPVASPFIPDGVREVFDLSSLMRDFLPPLPSRPLAPGSEWRRVAGETVWRLADSATAAGPIQRYRWARRTEWTDTLRGTGPVMPVLRREAEEGGMMWTPLVGPLGWHRTIRAEVLLQGEAGGRTTVTQEVTVLRMQSACQPASR
jgi:hypothetical protein